MDIQNKTPTAIQEEIYKALEQGVPADILKEELRKLGHHPEGYYFMLAAEREKAAAAPTFQESSSNLSAGQIIGIIITVIALIIKIARCSSKM